MQVTTPAPAVIEAIQEREEAFYFSKCFEALLAQQGILTSDDGSVGPGIVTRSFADIGKLSDAKPYLFEGPLAPEVVEAHSLSVTTQVADELLLNYEKSTFTAKICYQTLKVRTILPVDSRGKPQVVSHAPPDPRWRQENFAYQTFNVRSDERPLLFAKGADGERVVVGLQKGNRIFLGVPILGIIVQHFTCAPIEGASFYLPDRYCAPHFPLLIVEQLLYELALQYNQPYLRVAPWPAGKTSAFSIRHDFDRPMKREDLEDLLAFYDRWGIKSTWFWRVCEAERSFMDLVASHGHEVALHTEREGLDGFQSQEVDWFKKNFGSAMLGYSAHGGRGSCGYMGQRQFDWAAACNFEYGELLVVDSGFPVPCVSIRNDMPEIIDLWLPATHYSIDRGTAPDAYDLDAPLSYCKRRLERGEQMVIMNHPDIHLEQLKQFIEMIVVSDMWHTTLLECVRWCRQRSGLRARRGGVDTFELLRTAPLDYDIEVWLEGARKDGVHARYRLPANFDTALLSSCGSISLL